MRQWKEHMKSLKVRSVWLKMTQETQKEKGKEVEQFHLSWKLYLWAQCLQSMFALFDFQIHEIVAALGDVTFERAGWERCLMIWHRNWPTSGKWWRRCLKSYKVRYQNGRDIKIHSNVEPVASSCISQMIYHLLTLWDCCLHFWWIRYFVKNSTN